MTTGLDAYAAWPTAREFTGYADLWRWSVNDLEGFWASVWDHFEVRGFNDRVLGSTHMPARSGSRRPGELRRAHAGHTRGRR